jgi:hypothetical protein
LLYDILNSHPEVRMKGEIFRYLKGIDPAKTLEHVFRSAPVIKAAGFKLFYYHPMDDGVGHFHDSLASVKDLSVIHLKRQNILRTLISHKIALSNGVWKQESSIKKEPPRDKRVKFTVAELQEQFQRTRQWEANADARFKTKPLLNIFYEDLVQHRAATFTQISAFLNITDIEVQSQLLKQNPEPISALVENYTFLKAAFSSTKWHSFFED